MANPESMHRRRFLQVLGAGAATLSVVRPAHARELGGFANPTPESFAWRGGVVVDHEGRRMQGGIRVEDGVVVALGADVKEGDDLGGAWVCPGLVDAGCTVGLWEVGLESATRDDNEASDPVTPDARAWDGYNPLSEVVPTIRVAGITHMLVHPSPAGLVSGQAGMVRTAGRTRADAVVQAPAGLCVNLGQAGKGSDGSAPRTRMGVSMALRELFHGVELPDEDEAEKGRRGKKSSKKEPPLPDDDLAPRDLILRQARRGELPVLFKAERADDILVALELGQAFGLKTVVLGGAEAHLVASELSAAGVPVLLGPVTVQPDSFEHLHAVYDNAARLHAAGVNFALRTGAAHFARGLRVHAGIAVAHGLAWEAAIHSITASAGEILGIPSVGRLAPGMPATLLVCDGDPLQARSRVQRVFIDGRETSMATRQSRLYDRFRQLP